MLASATPAAPASAAPVASAPASPPLPSELVVLAQKMAALKITSLRFAVLVSVAERHRSPALNSLLALFGDAGSSVRGEETFEPAAANLTLGRFGTQLTFRVVGGAEFMYFKRLGRRDGGRPWIRLGPGGFGELLAIEGAESRTPAPPTHLEPTPALPSFARPPFTTLTDTLEHALTVRELAPAVLGGQPVSRFLATLRPGQLGSPAAPSGPVPQPPPPQPTLEVCFAANGMPVRIVLALSVLGVKTTATVDFPAVNFPLAIEAPPPAETLSLAELRRLSAKKDRRGHPAPARQLQPTRK